MRRVLVIGGGASGLTAAIAAAEQGAKVTLLEKNRQVGKKILVTGNGRCNLTNENQDGAYEPVVEARVPVYFVIGESDEYYGSGPSQEAYDSLRELSAQRAETVISTPIVIRLLPWRTRFGWKRSA